MKKSTTISRVLAATLATSVLAGVTATGSMAAQEPETSASVPTAAVSAEQNYQSFPDVPDGQWYTEAVNEMVKSGIINGCDDGLFHPERTLTVGEWCTLLVKIATYDGADITGGMTGSHWAYGITGVAEACALTRVINGRGHEDQPVNRGEALTGVMEIIVTATEHATLSNAKYAEQFNALVAANQAKSDYRTWTLEEIPDHETIEYNFRDTTYDGVSDATLKRAELVGNWLTVPHSWEPDSIVQAYNYGIIKGVDAAGTFSPLSTLTRAEAAQMLYNAGLTWRLRITADVTPSYNLLGTNK